MKTTITPICLMISAVCTVGGCGTLGNLIVGGTPPADPSYVMEPPNRIYGGVREDLGILFEPDIEPVETPAQALVVVPRILVGYSLMVLDLPLSAIGDTLTLPVTVPAAIERYQARENRAASEPASFTVHNPRSHGPSFVESEAERAMSSEAALSPPGW